MNITNRIGATAAPGPVTIRRRPRNGRRRLSACGAVGIALLCAGLLAGCGGGAHASSPSKVMSAALAYANCMRSHGVPDFPDSNSQGEFQLRPVKVENGRTTPIEDLIPSSPAFQAAQRVCGSFGSAGRQVTPAQEKQGFGKELKAAACMRANGVPGRRRQRRLGRKWRSGRIRRKQCERRCGCLLRRELGGYRHQWRCRGCRRSRRQCRRWWTRRQRRRGRSRRGRRHRHRRRNSMSQEGRFRTTGAGSVDGEAVASAVAAAGSAAWQGPAGAAAAAAWAAKGAAVATAKALLRFSRVRVPRV